MDADDLDGPRPAQGRATLLLARLREGDSAAAEELLPLLYGELHRLARRAMAGREAGHTLQPTALLNEAWIRLGPDRGGSWEDRQHFLAVAARAMRSVLVDRARRKGALKRDGGGERVDLDAAVEAFEERGSDLCALDEALEQLASLDLQLARVVELRFFGGLKHPAIAELLGVPLRRVERDWATARAWLHARLVREEGGER